MSLSNFAELAILDAIGNATGFAVTTPYVSLHDADPGETGTAEVTGGSYARQLGSFGAASSEALDNDAAITYALMPAVTVTHVGIFDAVSGGNFIWGQALDASQVVAVNNTFEFAIGALDAVLTGVTGLATFAADAILDAIFNNTSFSVTNPYTSLHTADPGNTGTSEVVGGSYARQLTSYGAAAAGQIQNDSQEDFTGMPAVTVTHAGIFDAVSAGNFIWGGDQSPDQAVGSGNTFRLLVGDITMTLD